MKNVPKCTKCNFHDYEYAIEPYGLQYKKHHWCDHNQFNFSKMILAKDMKTSPQWCPKRKENQNENS